MDLLDEGKIQVEDMDGNGTFVVTLDFVWMSRLNDLAKEDPVRHPGNLMAKFLRQAIRRRERMKWAQFHPKEAVVMTLADKIGIRKYGVGWRQLLQDTGIKPKLLKQALQEFTE